MVLHLSIIELLELRDGAVTEKKSRRLKVHLEACRSCRSKASQIEENLRQSSAVTIQAPSVASRVEAAAMNVQRSIRIRRRTETADPAKDRRNFGDSAGTRAQLVSELETYLGPHLTQELIREFDLRQFVWAGAASAGDLCEGRQVDFQQRAIHRLSRHAAVRVGAALLLPATSRGWR